ncbi:hypothetical protein [Dyadobacter tibetensis]|uniref:hypothetical protein n=1 Tax=Dyadobacter tibetensis TaxID=1211851 RepID=UPI000472F0C3|nr:hypothetical protein [Dyadobacter tibetensis]
MKNHILSIGLTLVSVSTVLAQSKIKDGTVSGTSSLPNANAILDLESANKGLLLPRVALSSTTLAAPLSAHVAGMAVYNTATTGDVVPGYYYNDGSKWVAGVSAASSTEPWFNQATDAEANANTQSIYQMGNVAVNKTDNLVGTSLDVEGAVHAGTGHSGTVGLNSATFGQNNVNAGPYSLVAGGNNVLWGTGSAVFGRDNNIGAASNEGNWSLVAGLRNQLDAGPAFVFGTDNSIVSHPSGNTSNYILGNNNNVNGRYNAAIGRDLVLNTGDQVVLGRMNAIRTSGNADPNSIPAATDPVLQVAVGNTQKNAMTILQNSFTGIGITGTEAAAKPTQMLDVGTGNVRVRDINTVAGGVSDKMVVADANGVLKTMPKQNTLLVGGDLSDALSVVTITNTPAAATYNTSLLNSYSIVITQKSLVTFSYDVSFTVNDAADNKARFIETYFDIASKPAGSNLALNSAFAHVRVPYSTATGGIPGFYHNSSSSRLVLEPGTYTVNITGGFYTPASGGGTVIFGGAANDHVTIVADPNF